MHEVSIIIELCVSRRDKNSLWKSKQETHLNTFKTSRLEFKLNMTRGQGEGGWSISTRSNRRKDRWPHFTRILHPHPQSKIHNWNYSTQNLNMGCAVARWTTRPGLILANQVRWRGEPLALHQSSATHLSPLDTTSAKKWKNSIGNCTTSKNIDQARLLAANNFSWPLTRTNGISN